MDHKANRAAKAEALAAGVPEWEWTAEFRGWRTSGAVPAVAAEQWRSTARQFAHAPAGPRAEAFAKGWDARA